MRSGLTVLITIGFYLLINILLYFSNPYASDWHYEDHSPRPLAIERPEDDSLGISAIEKTLSDIDRAYKAREADHLEIAQEWGTRLIQLIFFPSTAALMIKSFMGYMGPANQAQQEFTLSVKKRYNHLVKLGKAKRMKKTGFLFIEEPSLTKQNGSPY